jgi:hypothetical protein
LFRVIRFWKVFYDLILQIDEKILKLNQIKLSSMENMEYLVINNDLYCQIV